MISNLSTRDYCSNTLSLLTGVDRIHKSMLGYVKSISKRNEGDDKEKTLPIANLGSSMVAHGDDFDANSEYGRCMNSMLHLLAMGC